MMVLNMLSTSPACKAFHSPRDPWERQWIRGQLRGAKMRVTGVVCEPQQITWQS